MARMSAIVSAEAQDTETAIEALRRDGVVRMTGLFQPDALMQARALAFARHPEFRDLGEGKPGNDTGPGRFIAPVLITGELHRLGLFECAPLHRVADALLGSTHVVEAFGMMMSAVGSSEQKAHRDGELMFPESGIDSILPPTSLVVLVPLVDVTPESGATAFRLGSHRSRETDESHEGTVLTPTDIGDALVWDYRTEHCGLSNTSGTDRPALHFTLSRPFWFDHTNYGGGEARLVGEADVIAGLGHRYVRAQKV